MSILSWIVGNTRVKEPVKVRAITYTSAFARELDNFLDHARAYANGNCDKPPVPFQTLVANSANQKLFEGMPAVGGAPWYFIGSPEQIESVETTLKQKADEQGASLMLGKGSLNCMRKSGNTYVPCTLEEYVNTGAHLRDYRFNALPPSSAYFSYTPMLKAA